MQAPHSLSIQRPQVLVRLVACCLALDLPTFTQAQVRWADSQTVNDDVTVPNWWLPYEIFRGAAIMRPWAIAHMNYLNGISVDSRRLALIEPESFYRGIGQTIRDMDLHRDYVTVAEQAEAYTIPEQARAFGYEKLAYDLDMLYAQVGAARSQGKLITDSRRIRRLWKAA